MSQNQYQEIERMKEELVRLSEEVRRLSRGVPKVKRENQNSRFSAIDLENSTYANKLYGKENQEIISEKEREEIQKTWELPFNKRIESDQISLIRFRNKCSLMAQKESEIERIMVRTAGTFEKFTQQAYDVFQTYEATVEEIIRSMINSGKMEENMAIASESEMHDTITSLAEITMKLDIEKRNGQQFISAIEACLPKKYRLNLAKRLLGSQLSDISKMKNVTTWDECKTIIDDPKYSILHSEISNKFNAYEYHGGDIGQWAAKLNDIFASMGDREPTEEVKVREFNIKLISSRYLEGYKFELPWNVTWDQAVKNASEIISTMKKDFDHRGDQKQSQYKKFTNGRPNGNGRKIYGERKEYRIKQEPNEDKRECFKCHERGHIAKNCTI